jgi:curved DNA-binding protein CbpA
MEFIDYYKVLGFLKTVLAMLKLKKAYRVVRKLHPDLNPLMTKTSSQISTT